MTYQKRYIAYASAMGRSPDQQLAWDETHWPGGKMAGFMLWISEAWHRWGQAPEWGDAWSDRQHEMFDAWLSGS